MDSMWSLRNCALMLLVLLLVACAAQPLACQRPAPPEELNPNPPPPEAFQKCLQGLEAGETWEQTCNALPSLPTS
jgi:hypothetical protein